MSILLHICLPCVCLVPMQSEEGVRFPECGCWELNPESLKSSKSSLQPLKYCLKNRVLIR